MASSSPPITMTTVAMTNLFTPPASCSNSWTFEPPAANHVRNGLLIQNDATSDNANPSCFPSGFSHYGRIQATQVFSPGYCPIGYTSANLAVDRSTTSAICCLSGYSYFTEAQSFAAGYSLVYAGCTRMLPSTSSTIVTIRQDPGESTQVTGPITMWAQPIQVQWQSSDLNLFVPASTTSAAQPTSMTAPTAPTITSTTTPTTTSSLPPTGSGSNGLSTGTAIGVGVGVGVGGLAIFAAFGLWFLHRLKAHRKTTVMNVPKQGPPYQAPSYPGADDMMEKTQPSGPSELDTSGSGVNELHELHG